MADSVVVAIADKVVAMLSEAELSQVIDPARSYTDWEQVLTEAGKLQVDVVAVTDNQTADLDARDVLEYQVSVFIAVRKKFGQDEQTHSDCRIDIELVDELCLLTQEIHKLFTAQRMTGFASSTWDSTKLIVNPSRKTLHEMRQFCGLVQLTFIAHEDL